MAGASRPSFPMTGGEIVLHQREVRPNKERVSVVPGPGPGQQHQGV